MASKHNDPIDWQERFTDQGKELNELRAHYQDHVELLQRVVSRLCLTVDESNPSFESEVRELRRKLKGDKTSLPDLAQCLSDLDARLLQEQDEAPKTKLPQSDHSPFGYPASEKDSESLWSRMKGYLGATARSLPATDQSSAVNEGSLASGLESHRIDTDEDVLVELPNEEALKGALEQAPGYDVIAGKVSEILINLLSEMSFPESALKDVKALRHRIAGRVNWYELPPTLEDLTNRILSSLGEGQRQFDSFLLELDQQLEGMTSFLSAHSTRDQSWRHLSEQLQNAMRQEELPELTDGAYEELSPQEREQKLKDSIRERLERMSRSAVEYAKKGEELGKAFAPELDRMRQRVSSLSREQKQLRKKLKEERAHALTDILTNLPNREAYDERLEFEYTRWMRYENPGVVVASSIDNFDDIQRKFGQLSGDKTLQIVAKELSHRVRKTDFVARFSGDKFVFILPVTELGAAEQVLHKTCESISALPFHFRALRVRLTMSFGMVPFSECEHFSLLTDKAEDARALAQSRGGHCVATL